MGRRAKAVCCQGVLGSIFSGSGQHSHHLPAMVEICMAAKGPVHCPLLQAGDGCSVAPTTRGGAPRSAGTTGQEG